MPVSCNALAIRRKVFHESNLNVKSFLEGTAGSMFTRNTLTIQLQLVSVFNVCTFLLKLLKEYANMDSNRICALLFLF